MTSRTLFRALIAAPFIAWVAPVRSVERYGYMDVERWWFGGFNKRGAKVLLNGRDMTDGCVWFNDVTGELCRLKYDASGEAYVDPSRPDEVAKEVLRGQVEVAA